MPSALLADEDDPVIASYDVYLSNSNHDDVQTSKLLLLQYPSYRPWYNPYNAANSQKPHSIRLKPETGLVEMEIPILTQQHYNALASEKFGQALTENRSSQYSRSYGLAGGFNNSSNTSQNVNLEDIPFHDQEINTALQTQTLGGKSAQATERDPVYMLGMFQNGELHLSQLDAIVQMRPQLHHIDAEEDLNQKKYQSASAFGGKLKPGLEPGMNKLETKAIELKLKDNKEDAKDRNLNENAKLLRDIQREAWQSYEWQDQDTEITHQVWKSHLELADAERGRQLRSSVSNDEWLEKMSAPREDGKKGLRSKLKGRDRERARRKKVENQKRLANAVTTMVADQSSNDSETSAASDIDIVDPAEGLGQEDIKQEPGSLAAAPEQVPKVPNPVPVTNTPTRRRGRPRKDTVSVDG